MEKVNLTHGLFTTIRAEHRLLESKLSEIKSTTDFTELIDWFWNFIELNHHQKEELILFEYINKNPRIGEGGPLCSLYFDYHISDSPMRRVEKIINSPVDFEPHQINLINNGSPIKIPLSEHVAGKNIIRFLKKKLAQLQKNEIQKYLLEYEKIQLEHIAKEESCFFHLCSNLLKPIEADQLLAQWNFLQISAEDDNTA